MQKFINIKAIFFLVLFSMFLLHQSVPHFHHEHEVTLNVIEHSHDHEQHQHHDDIPEKKEGGLNGFIDLFLEMHVHGEIADENIMVRQLSSIQKIDKKVVFNVFSLNSNIVLKDIKEVEKPSVYHPPEDYFNSYTSYNDLRGPPSLG